MKYRIGIFSKTEHFMLKQWKRDIDDTMVETVLLQIKQSDLSSKKNSSGKSLLLEEDSFRSSAELFIVID